MPLLHGKSTYPGCSDFRSHLCFHPGAVTVVTPNRSQVPAGIWAVGFVSLLKDISSAMIHSLLA